MREQWIATSTVAAYLLSVYTHAIPYEDLLYQQSDQFYP